MVDAYADCIRVALTADGLLALTAPYYGSLDLIRSLLDLLTTFPPLPQDLAPGAPQIQGIRLHQSDRSAEGSKQKGKAGKKDENEKRPAPEEIQAAMSLLAVQPLIPGKGSPDGPDAWEDTLAVEVGNLG